MVPGNLEFVFGMLEFLYRQENRVRFLRLPEEHKTNKPSKNSLARLLTNTDPANMQSGGAISSIESGDVPLIAYELISSVPPPASAIRKPCLDGSAKGFEMNIVNTKSTTHRENISRKPA